MSDTAPDFRALCAELLDELQYQTSYETNAELQDRARAALATPPPGPPADSDKEESERLRSLFDLTRRQMADALGVDRGYGWTSLAMEARQLREDRALATPPPEPPTDEELDELWDEEARYFNLYEEARRFARAVLEKWGQ